VLGVGKRLVAECEGCAVLCSRWTESQEWWLTRGNQREGVDE